MAKQKINKPDNSPKIFQREKLTQPVKIREYPLTEKQKAFIELSIHKDTRIIFLSGPAGSSKSFLSVLSALTLLNEKKISDFFYVRPIIESADSGSRLGFLPGDYNAKIAPYEQVLFDKLEELVNAGDMKRLQTEERFKTLTVNYLRGASLTAKMGIIDESQGFCLSEMKTILTRIGKYSKFIVCADPTQSDLPLNKQGGFMKLFNHFKDSEEAQKQGIFCVEFDSSDIQRSALCAYLVGELEKVK